MEHNALLRSRSQEVHYLERQPREPGQIAPVRVADKNDIQVGAVIDFLPAELTEAEKREKMSTW